MRWWEDIHPHTRRKILRVTVGLIVLGLVVTLWLNRYLLQPKRPPPDFSAYLRVEEPRESLLENFRSYDSERSVARQLHQAGLEWTADRTHIEGTYQFPPYKLDTLVVREYQNRGMSGTLTLEFFNDRLLRVTFNPVEANNYYFRVQAGGVRFDKISPSVWEYEAGNLRIRSNIIYAISNMGQALSTVPYVSWEDIRLSAQDRQWYDSFGSKYAMTPVQSKGAGYYE